VTALSFACAVSPFGVELALFFKLELETIMPSGLRALCDMQKQTEAECRAKEARSQWLRRRRKRFILMEKSESCADERQRMLANIFTSAEGAGSS
jgi:hypothetical protein